MCFSPEASFIASAGLAVVGVETLRIAKKKEKVLAALPFMFAVQQGIEGVQWLALQQGQVNVIAGYTFLFFALLVWPTYIPFAVYLLDDMKRHILRWFVLSGATLSFFYLWIMFTTPLAVEVVNKGIVYHADFPRSIVYGLALLYIFIVSAPFLISSKPLFRWFGLLAFISAFLAVMFFLAAFVSVWCFFAAGLSSLIYFYVRHLHTQMR